MNEADLAIARIEKDSMALMEEQARSYQVELFEYAKKKNTIVCLGTGTGKTFISVLLVKYLEHETTGPWLDEATGEVVGKRTIFLAPNVPLVEQQSAVLAQHMTVKVGTFVGSMDVDRWTAEHWNPQLQENGVLVMTPEVCRRAVHHGFIPLENINLLVLDECHRATGVDPYVKIMESYKNLSPESRPKILGLTASVVNAQVQGFQVAKKVRDLEACLFSTARTASQNIVQFGTKPTELILAHETHDAEKELPINEDKMALLKDCADFSEFRKAMKALAKTYGSCGAFCAKKLLEFRERELEKALKHPDCADGFREHAPIKVELYKEIQGFLGPEPSIYDVPPKMKSLLKVLKEFQSTNMSAVVFVQERLVAYVLYIWMTQLSREYEYSFINCSFIVGQNTATYGRDVDQESLKMNARAQNKVMRDFRNGVYNLMFATSVIEEGMDVPACNLIVRFDPPMDVRSYTQSKGRARAKPSLYVLLSAEEELAKTRALLDSYQETEQLVMECCGTERSAPTAFESAEALKEDPDLPPYIVEHAKARITAHSAVSLVNSYCQQFMRMKYPNVFPFFEFEETPDSKYICTLTMPIVCPIRERISNASHPFDSKDKAKMWVALEMCRRLHLCGELADNLLPRRRYLNLYKLPTKPEDVQAKRELREAMVLTGPKSHQKRRYVLPRKQAEILELKEETVNYEPTNTYHLYVIKTEVVAWASKEQNWRGETLFDPSKYPTWLAIVMRAKYANMDGVPKFPIFTRSGEECVSFVDAGPITLNDELKTLCSRFNRYVFHVVLEIIDDMLEIATKFASPCLVPVKEKDGGKSFELDMDVLHSLGPAKLPDFSNFVFKEEDYHDGVVELLFHLDQNMRQFSRQAHTRCPQDVYRRFYVVETTTRDEEGKPLTPNTTGYYGFNKSLSFADYAFQRVLRTGPAELLKEYQPVMTVEHTHRRLQMLYPRFENQQERRYHYESDPGTKYLVPQFVAVHAIKASLWRKISSIPSILHRLNRLLTAENVRRDIALTCRLKQSVKEWPPMKFKRSVKEKLKETPQREFDALIRNCKRDFDASKLKFVNMAQPDLENCEGPSPCDILNALTTKACGEIFDLERLELLGDSFLQIVSTFAVYDRNPAKSISELNTLRQYEVNNRHLLCRAHDKGLTSVLEAYPFRATHNFLPFGCKPIPFEEKLLLRDILLLIVDAFDYDMDLTAKLKDLRYCQHIVELLDGFARDDPQAIEDMVRETSFQDDQLPLRHDVPVRTFHDFKAKVGGDVVEALVGVYLEQCGPVGALRFFKWIGKDFGDSTSGNFLDAFKLEFTVAQKVPASELKPFQYLIDKVEKQIGYTFKTKGLVLQAISHHSCRDHILTEDYNSLGFVGEAVVDYLLTLYIYNLSSNLNPGQLTDLRSALINNQVTAHAVVRAELHTVLLYSNSKMFTAIRKYLENIDEIGLRLNTVLGDWETDDAEEAEVPRPLAKLFQSILGAVFIDSGKSFETVWRILVNIMGYEIALFTNNVPLSPVSELCKKFPGTVFSKAVQILEGEDEGKFEVKLHVQRNGKTESYAQISESKKIAKTTLAKRYLRKLEREKKLAEIEELKKAHVTDDSVVTISDVLFDSEVQKSKFYRTKK